MRPHGQHTSGWGKAIKPALLLLLVLALVYAAHVTTGFGGGGHEHLWNHWLYDSVIGASALLCLLRARSGEERLAWGSIGVAIFLYWLGDLYWNNFLADLARPPYPTWADAGWLSYYLPMYLGLMLVIRARVAHVPVSTWLEGLVGALALGSVVATVVFEPLVASTHGSTSTVITNLAYPTLDLLMLMFVACGFVIMGHRAGLSWMLLGVGLLIAGGADSVYLVQAAKGTYSESGWVNAGWPLSTALIACAAWMPAAEPRRLEARPGWLGLHLLTGCFASLILGMLVLDSFSPIPVVAHVLMTLAVVVLLALLALAGSERRQLVRAAAEVRTDELTGLANRRSLYETLDKSLGAGEPLALLFLDLDRYMELSDTLGNDTGEDLLRQVAARLRTAMCSSPLVARIGGDGFVVVLDAGQGPAGALRAARAVRDALDAPFPLDGLLVTVRASIGVALAPAHASTRVELLRCADVAMCRARAQHTGIELYRDEGEDQTFDHLLLVSELRGALERDELVMHYQPKVAIAERRLVGVEALVRWQHPRLGLLSPESFVPLVEREGLMRLLTLKVLDLALAQQRQWRKDGVTVPVAVNLSPSNLMDTRLPADVAELLRRHGTAPHELELEITEETLMHDPTRALDVIARIGELGVEFSLDDFGTGYSSLAQLRRLPVHTLKIDRSFVIGMTDDEEDANIVRSTIQLGRSLHLRVIAEGVESAEHLAALERYGCDIAQGFYLGRPMLGDTLIDWLRSSTEVEPPASVGERLRS